MRIAIHSNPDIFDHYSSWNKPWIEYCEKNKLDYELVDCYDYDIIEKLKNFDILLWHVFGNVIQDISFARSILYTAKNMGVKVFPDFDESWHFEDKVSETYILQSVDAPIPKTWMFFTESKLLSWIHNSGQFPVVAKLKSGAGSNNVTLINNANELKRYGRKMFSTGVSSSSKFTYKAISQVKSSKNINDIKSKLKKIPQYINKRRLSKQLPREKGYVYFQEFLPNYGYDLKVIVVGDKLSFVGRKIRKNDFRASGGGNLFYEKEILTNDIIKTAFKISDTLNFQCMGYDFVIDSRDKKAKIIEISYGFSHTAQLDLGGYFDREGIWHNEPLNAPVEILKNLIDKLD